MDYIERPKEVVRAESSVQNNEFIQKNMQEQLNTIYDYLDKLKDSLNQDTGETETVLFDSSTGRTSSFTISDSFDNYKKLKVTVGRGTDGSLAGRVLEIDLEKHRNSRLEAVPLDFVDVDTSYILIYTSRVQFTGSMVRFVTTPANRVVVNISNWTIGTDSTYKIGIYKIVGIK